MDFTQSMDNGYMIPSSIAVGSGEATDIRCVCDTVEDFKSFLDTTGMELRYEGLVTYEKVNKLLKVYKGDNVWQVVGEGGGNVDTSSFITLTQLSQQLNNYYTKTQADSKILEEIAKAQLSSGGSIDLINSNSNTITYIPGVFSNYISNVKSRKLRDEISGTTYHLTYIPHKDIDGVQVKMYNGFGGSSFNAGDVLPTSEYAKEVDASVCINSGVFNVSTLENEGTCIKDGEVLQNKNFSNHYILAWKDDNTMGAFPGSKSGAELIAEGYNNAVTGFVPIISDGVEVSEDITDICPHGKEKHPRQVIAQMQNKDIVILGCDGRLTNEAGMTLKDCVRILLPLGVKFAYNLDGGGSRSTILKNKKIDVNIENTERRVPSYIYFNRGEKYENLYDNETVEKINAVENKVDEVTLAFNNFTQSEIPLVIKKDGKDYKLTLDDDMNVIVEGFTRPSAGIVSEGLQYQHNETVSTTLTELFDTNYNLITDTNKDFTIFFRYDNLTGQCSDGAVEKPFLGWGSSDGLKLCIYSGNPRVYFNRGANTYGLAPYPSKGTTVICIRKKGLLLELINADNEVFQTTTFTSEAKVLNNTVVVGATNQNGSNAVERYHTTTFHNLLIYNRGLEDGEVLQNLNTLKK